MSTQTTTAADRIAEIAERRFGWEQLRPEQHRAVAALLKGRDTVVVLPTGYGKSAIYQLAGALSDGLTVVVSPLIALQMDQLAGLAEREDAPTAVAINSAVSDGELEDAWRSIDRGEVEYVFLAPEQLAKDEVVARLRRAGVGLFAIDEAHCVASWGHDFRPDYLRLGAVREQLGRPTTVALTATGAEPVRVEIVQRLALDDVLEVVAGFDRPNIHLAVTRAGDDAQKRTAVLDEVLAMEGDGLLYVATRRDAERYAEQLRDAGRAAEAYHAGLTAKGRTAVHEAFLDGEVQIVVATNAFGMGIDKPDVRFVVHASIPGSLDAYYQEVGRAGRDGGPARAVLHYRAEDLGMRRYFEARSPDRARLRAAFAAVEADGPLRAAELGRRIDVATRTATGLLNLLAEGGAIGLERRGARARSGWDPGAAVDAAVEAAERRERIEQSRVDQARGYAETGGCRRQALLAYFGERLDEPCGACDTCADGRAAEAGHRDDGAKGVDATEDRDEGGFREHDRVEHAEWGEGVVVSLDDGRITVFFDAEGYKVLDVGTVVERGLLRAA